MKITKNQLKKIIQEEVAKMTNKELLKVRDSVTVELDALLDKVRKNLLSQFIPADPSMDSGEYPSDQHLVKQGNKALWAKQVNSAVVDLEGKIVNFIEFIEELLHKGDYDL